MFTEKTSVRASNDFRFDINGLRAIAVSVVVLFHFGTPGFSGGFIGVDVFFVISGYLMTAVIDGKLRAGRFSILEFYAARARRIIPALLVLCLFLIVSGFVFLDPHDYEGMARNGLASLAFVSNILYWTEAGYFARQSHENWLLHTWSLSVEWQFYLIYPIIVLLAQKGVRGRFSFGWVVAVGLVLSLIASIVITPIRAKAAFFWLPTRAWELLGGGLVYYLSNFFNALRFSFFLHTVGLILIGYSTVVSRSVNWPGSAAIVPVLGTVFVLLSSRRDIFWSKLKIVNTLGLASYSIYLWHWPIVVALSIYGLGGVRWIVLGVATSLAFGLLSYRYIETPVRRFLAMHGNMRCLAFLLFPTLIVAIGLGIIISTDGVIERLGKDSVRYERYISSAFDWKHPGKFCHRGTHAVDCLINGIETRKILVVGDSHAEQWYSRFESVVGGNPSLPTIRFFTTGACPPISGLETLSDSPNCVAFNEELWSLATNWKPDVMILSSYWRYFFDENGKVFTRRCLIKNDGCKPVTVEADVDDAFERLEKDIARVIASGTHVVIIGPTPIGREDFVDVSRTRLASSHLPMLIRNGSLPSNGSTFLLLPNFFGYSILMAKLKEVASQTGAEFVDPAFYLCKSGICPYSDEDGVSFYKDKDHLKSSYVDSDMFLWVDKAFKISP